MYENEKKMIDRILDMNGGRFIYAPSTHLYMDGTVILSVYIIDSESGERRYVQDYKGDIFDEMCEAVEDLRINAAQLKAAKIKELEKQLEELR